MAARTSITVRVSITGLAATRAAFRAMPAHARVELKDATQDVSRDLAQTIRAAAAASDAQSGLMASTVKARRGQVPSVQAGGTRRVGRNRKPAYKVLFGSEFGSNHLRQFRPHVGNKGYWFFPTVDKQQPAVDKAWNDAADAVIRAWGAGG